MLESRLPSDRGDDECEDEESVRNSTPESDKLSTRENSFVELENVQKEGNR